MLNQLAIVHTFFNSIPSAGFPDKQISGCPDALILTINVPFNHIFN